MFAGIGRPRLVSSTAFKPRSDGNDHEKRIIRQA